MQYTNTEWSARQSVARIAVVSPSQTSHALCIAIRVLVLLLAGLTVIALRPKPAAAAEITVTTTIQTAINAANPGDTVIVPAGSYTESLTLSKAVSLTGALSSTTFLYGIPSSKIMTVTGSSIDNSVVISGLTFANGTAALGSTICPKFCAGAVYVYNNARPQFQNVIFTNNVAEQGGALYAESGSSLSLLNVQFYSNTADNQGGAIFTRDSATIANSIFYSNTSTNSHGGALYSELTVTLSSSQLISNATGGRGGAAYVVGNLYVQNSSISHNRTTRSNLGGGFLVQGSLVVTSSEFYSNTSVLAGAAASVGGNLTLIDSQVLTNTATRDAGGFDVSGNAVISNVLFFGNIATHSSLSVVAGAIKIAGSAALTSVQFISNSAIGSGGALNIVGDASIVNSYFELNQSSATASTGGAMNVSGQTTVSNTTFVSNTAGDNGGALSAVNSLTVINSFFTNNRAVGGEGGAINSSSLGTVVTNTEFRQNRALLNGGAIRVAGSIALYGGLMYDNSCSDVTCKGGSVYVNSGQLDLTGTQVISNTAHKGGGICVNSGAAFVSNALFESNNAVEVGALSVSQNLVMTNTDVLSNTASGGVTSGGGGVYAQGGASVSGGLFLNNIERGTNHRGGGLYVSNGTLIVDHARFISNLAALGGAIYHTGGDAFVTNTLLIRNLATATNGMAVYFGGAGRSSIVHSTIASPTLTSGYAIHVNTGSFTATNNIIVNHAIAINEVTPGLVQEDYNLYSGNGANTNGTVVGYGHSMTGNPAFVNMAADDYHITYLSLALDRAYTGTSPLLDYEGDARPQAWGPDIGADESPEPIVVDLAITKTASSATVLPGQPVTYSISYRNHGPQPHGPQPVPPVVITDVVPAELLNTAMVTSGMPLSQTSGITYAWAISNLWPNQGGYITVTGIVDARVATPTLIANTAVIFSMFDTVTTTNNSSSAPITVQPPRIIVGAVSALEGDTGTRKLVFPVSLSTANPYAPAYVSYATVDGSATAGSDYIATSGVLTFSAGQTNQAISVTVNGDTDFEANETLTMVFSTSVGAVLSDTSAIGTLLNDDITIPGLQVLSSAPTTLGQTTFFTASASTNGTLTYTWNYGDNAAESVGATASHVYSSAGLYTAIMTVSNGLGVQVLTLPVTVTNQRPLAKAGADQNVIVSMPVTLDGSASNDPDGHVPLAYGWRQTGGPTVVLSANTLSRTTFIAPIKATVLTFTLMVTDAYGLAAIADDPVVIYVGELPIAGLQLHSDSPTIIGNVTHLTASVATGTNMTFTWGFGDGSAGVAGSGLSVAHTYATLGHYVATLTATNGAGYQVVTGTIAVVDAEVAGVVLQGPLTATVGLTGTFTVSAEAGTNIIFSWMVDGQVMGSGAELTHVFDTPGQHVVSVLISNGSSSLTRSLTVTVSRDDKMVYLPFLSS